MLRASGMCGFGVSAVMRAVFLAAFSALFMCGCARSERMGLDNLMRSVVKIDVWEVVAHDGEESTELSFGSGAIISPDGYVITNAHVVNPYAEKILITLPCLERVSAVLVGWDHWTDLALLKIDEDEVRRRNLGFSYARFGDSDKVESTDTVYAVGTPHGYARTITKGIISNTVRYFDGEITDSGYETGLFNTWLQTDAAVNPGNSGGPLCRPDGAIIGINTRAAVLANNLGFAVPSNVARKVAKSLAEKGVVERSYVGVSFTPARILDSENSNAASRGVVVKNVDVGSPAHVAGILAGDVVVAIDGVSVDGRYPEQLPAIMNSIAERKTGSEVKFKIFRGGKTFEKVVKTEKLESRVGRMYTLKKWGAGIVEITKALRRERRLVCESSAMVSGVRNGFPFALADIAEGDIILSVGDKQIKTCKDLIDEYEKLTDSKKKVLIKLQRNHAISYHLLN